MKRQNLGEILDQFFTDLGRAEFVSQLIEKQAVPREYIDRTVLLYERAGK